MTKVAVIDVGSNTVRMLVAKAGSSGAERVHEDRARIGLGADVEASGRISAAKLAEVAECTSVFAAEARARGCTRIEVIATSPGRQAANAGRLMRTLAAATRAPVRVLDPEEEGALAYSGAVAWASPLTGSVAVCDVGGGSTQVAVGTADAPIWLRSIDIGSLRLAERFLHADPPGKRAISEARACLRAEFEGITPPLPQTAFAVGGTARALTKIVGKTLGEEELRFAVRALRSRKRAEIAREHRIDRCRIRTLAGGALILSEVQRRLAVPLHVAAAGLREGYALSLLAEANAA